MGLLAVSLASSVFSNVPWQTLETMTEYDGEGL